MENQEKLELTNLPFSELKKEMATFFDIPLERVNHFFEMLNREKGPYDGTSANKSLTFSGKWRLREVNDNVVAIETTERISAEGKPMDNLSYLVRIDRTGKRFNQETQSMEPFHTLQLSKGAAKW